jgi:hypothetical protein
MQRTSGDERNGVYQASIGGQPHGTLVRFRIKASNAETTRIQPGPNEPLPTFSYCTMQNTNKARVAFAYVIHVSRTAPESTVRVWNKRVYEIKTSPTRSDSAFIYVPPAGEEVQTFDHVYMRRRKGGMKVHFKKEHSFKGMTGINVTFESSPRWLLSEPMAYELYRLAGVPACLTEHVRLWVDGRLAGYYLVIEQPNKSFLARNKRNDAGSMYKVYWMYQGVVDQHRKKTRRATEPDDLVSLDAGLTKSSGEQQWQFIQKNFNVDEFASYYAVNMCIENWDGFFNNYFLYHDEKDTGKWEMYPWDEDKTWGDYDGASRSYDWYDMPLTYGMDDGRSRSNRGFLAVTAGSALRVGFPALYWPTADSERFFWPSSTTSASMRLPKKKCFPDQCVGKTARTGDSDYRAFKRAKPSPGTRQVLQRHPVSAQPGQKPTPVHSRRNSEGPCGAIKVSNS